MSSFFGGSTAGTIPVPPPASLFPGTTGALATAGPGAVGTATNDLSQIASGADVNSIYASIVAASKQATQTGQANLSAAMGAEGMASSSDMMRASAQYQTQANQNLLQQLQTLSLTNEQLQMGAGEGLLSNYTNVGTSFAPTAAVVSGQSPNIAGTLVGAGTNAAMLAFLFGA